ncbi:MAG: tRNA (adenosine(37)-N6)-threonylcarbamoyltransferase complex dimerization subunit type 1 TsaB [Thermoleophilia bacterium]|nr:tRNA (adenosine(37)-N6)-threonylcarbamoyltransferase complex dimerization subunit type 1 TsaB [Thermoleophilia bacterium]
MAEQVVLTLDGSTRVCSVALVARGVEERYRAQHSSECRSTRSSWAVIGRESVTDARSQARSLLPMIERLLTGAGLEREDLSAVVVGVGPGTFTGVRVAVATARAISLALEIPVIGVSSLAALAAQVAVALGEEARGAECLVPLIDAHRRQVFYAVYDKVAPECGQHTGHALWRPTVAHAVCDVGGLSQVVRGGALVIADEARLAAGLPSGAELRICSLNAEYLVKGQDLLTGTTGSSLETILDRTVLVDSGRASRLPLGDPGIPGTPESVVPIYVRSPDADVHITKMKDPWASEVGSRRPAHEG